MRMTVDRMKRRHLLDLTTRLDIKIDKETDCVFDPGLM
jgi:hypothetical protein